MEPGTCYCYQCGQRMVRLYWDEYQYKGHVLVNRKIRQYKEVRFCGWNCMRAFEKGEPRKVEDENRKSYRKN